MDVTPLLVLVACVVLALVLALTFGLGVMLGDRRSDARSRTALAEAARAQALLEAARSDDERAADRFRTLAADALATSSEQFLALAHQRLAAEHQTQAGELVAREQAFRDLLEPLSHTLDEVRGELGTAQLARARGEAALDEQLQAMRAASTGLAGETARLVTALRSSHVRGRWGELQLRRVVEASGLAAHVDFVEQARATTDDGVLRPDLVVRLAGGKNIVVDAKVPFLGYLEATSTDDETLRAQRLAAHVRHVRAHIDALAAKRYWEQFAPAPEMVVMFVPAESFLPAALDQDPTIVEYAFEHDVVLATPSTLLALLRTVAYAWRQDALATNAQAVLTLGRELHGRLATLGGHLARLGRSLDGAATAYNQTVASLETRVLVSARRFADLGVVDTGLDTPPTANPRLSSVSAPELVASASEQVVALDEHEPPAWRPEAS